jgi:uncharacterized protein
MILGLALRWFLLGVCLLGHVSFFIYCFNRINATGFNRKLIKVGEKLIIATTVIIPFVVFLIDRKWLTAWLGIVGSESLMLEDVPVFPITSSLFFFVAIASLVAQTPSWILGRPSVHGARSRVKNLGSTRLNTHRSTSSGPFAKNWVRRVGGIPGNQLHLIETSVHQVQVDRLPTSLDGLRIGHLSDLHLTGYMHREFYREAIASLMELKPEIVILSGDVIDYDECLPQVQPLLEHVCAPLGCYFVLGNHDRRLSDVPRLRKMLVEVGWHDLGTQSMSIEKNTEEIFFVGNERPWFDLENRRLDEIDRAEHRKLSSLRIGVSHSPDQLPWAQKLELDLLFCGHTHGGQIRFPLVGPIIAPSWYGSRYASGWFEKSPTLMHVSRGLSGTHPFRFACTPEVTLCILKDSSSHSAESPTGCKR